ncbi:MAG: PepSY-like domain-containing protein [Phycisphaerales bacterium]|nr:PepSY-like domain-containing protein [Phycisphaerales bacterium]
MKILSSKAAIATALVVLTGAAIGFTTTRGDEDEVVKLKDVPAAARQAIQDHSKGLKIEKIERSTEGGKTVYEVSTEGADGDGEFLVAEDGTYLGQEQEDDDNEQGEAAEHGRAEAPHSEDVTEIDFAAAPAPVRDVFNRSTGNAKATKVERIVDEGVTKFEIEFARPAGTASMTLSDRGDVMEVESPVAIDSLPEAVTKAVLHDYPGAKIKAAEGVQLFYYEMDVEVNGKTIEVAAFATGDIEDRLVGDEESDGEHASGGDEDGEKARGGAKHEGDEEDEDDDD